MIDTVKTVDSATANRTPVEAATHKLFAAAMFGLVFGFLLQKGGVGKYNVLIGQLLLQDWTVVKIILTAIVVGMIGVFTLHHFGKVNLHIKPPAVTASHHPVTTKCASARIPQRMQLARTANH